MTVGRPLDLNGLPRLSASILIYYLSWPERLQVLAEALASTPPSYYKVGPLKSKFLNALPARYPQVSGEDLRAIADQLWTSAIERGPVDIVRAILTLSDINLDFQQSEVIVETQSAQSWIDISSHIDISSIIAIAFTEAHAEGAPSPRDSSFMPIVPTIADPDIAIALNGGLVDLHVHLGGLRSAHLIWQRLVRGDYSLKQIRRYSAGYRATLGTDAVRAIQLEERLVCAAVDALAGSSPLATYLNVICDPDLEILRKALLKQHSYQRHKLECSPEITSLIEAKIQDRLCRVVRLTQANGGHEGALLAFDLFCTAKSLFVATLQQPNRENPGLELFRNYYKATKPIFSHPKAPPSHQLRSPSLEARLQYADLAYYIRQSAPPLQRLELRLEPGSSLKDYVAFFKAWDEIEDQYKFEQAGLRIRFALHFKRTADKGQRGRNRNEPGRVTLQRELDYQAFLLHKFRQHPLCNRWARRIVRCDLAGQERDASPDVAIFQMKLLQGDRHCQNALNAQNACDDTAHKYWKALAERHALSPPIALPRLRMTCHAGEDNAHPLEGLQAIDTALRELNLKAGDTIGHGLAATWDIERFEETRLRFTVTLKGKLFDMLLWLRLSPVVDQTANLGHVRTMLDARLHELFSEIYHLPSLPNQAYLRELMHVRCGPIPDRNHPPVAEGRQLTPQQLFWREVWNEELRHRRDAPAPLDREIRFLADLRPAIEAAQKRLLHDLAEQGVVLEFNPSSNLRVSGARSLKEIPFVAHLADVKANACATICSDDPGIFGTRIENEYAILISALRQAGTSRLDAISIAERLRHCGLERIPFTR